MVQFTKLNNQDTINQLTEINDLITESINKKSQVQEEKIKAAKEVFTTKNEILAPTTSVDNPDEFDYIEKGVGLPKGTLYALMQAETEAYPKTRDTVISPKGAVGAFQFMPHISSHYGIDPTNRHEAALAAAQEIKNGLNRYDGDIDKAIAAYNLGSGNFANLDNDLSRVPDETKQHGDRFRKYATPAQVDIPEPRLDTFAEDFLGQADSISGTPAPKTILADSPQLSVAQAKQALLDEQNALNATDPAPLKDSQSVAISEQLSEPRSVPDISTPGQLAATVIESKSKSSRPEIPIIPEDPSVVSDQALKQDAETADKLFDPETQYNQPISPVEESLASSKTNSAETIRSIKQRFLAPESEPIDIESNNDSFNRLLNTQDQVQSDSPIVEQQGNISKHANGLYTVRTAEGKVLSGLNEFDAKTFAAYNQENARAKEADAPTSFLGTKAHAIAQSTVDLGVQAASAFTEDPNNLKAIADFGENLKSKVPVNRKEQVAAYTAFQTIAKNQGNWAAIKHTLFNDLGTLISQGIDSTPYMVAFTLGGPIAQLAILTSLALGKGNQAVEEFTRVNGRRPTEEENIRIKIWSAIGTIAEKYGDMAAVRAIPGRLAWMKQVAKTVQKTTPPSILSLTVLRPATALAGEALSGGITSASEQMAAEGEITDSGVIAYDSLAEAAGTPGGMATMATGSALINTALNIKDATKNIAANRKLKKAAIEDIKSKLASEEPVIFGQTREGQAKRSTLEKLEKEISEHELSHKPGTNKEILQKIVEKDTLKKELARPLTGPETVAYKKELQGYLDRLDPKKDKAKKVEEEKVPEEISDEDFQTTLGSIDSADTKTVIAAFKKLNEIKLTPEQFKLAEKARDDYLESKQVEQDTQEEPRTLGSLQNTSPEELTELSKTADPTDKKFIAAQIEANRLKAKLTEIDKANPKTIGEVHDDVVEGQDSRWKGLVTYLNEIIEATEDPEFTKAKLTGRIASIESNMQVHADNLQKKLAEFKRAKQQVTEQNPSVYVKTTQVGKGRSVSYDIVDKSKKDEAYITEIHKNSTRLINIIQQEVDFSKQILQVALDYKDTSFGKSAALQFAAAESARHLTDTLKELTFKQQRQESTEEDIKSIKDPIQNKFLGINWTVEGLKSEIESIKTLIQRKKQAFKDSKIPDEILAEITELEHEAELAVEAVEVKTGIRPIPDTPSSSEEDEEEIAEVTQSKEILTASIKSLQKKLPEDLSTPEAADILAEIGKLHEAIKALSKTKDKSTGPETKRVASKAPETGSTTEASKSSSKPTGKDRSTEQPPVDKEVPDSTEATETTTPETVTKESVRLEFPDVVTQEGELVEEKELEGKESSLDQLAEVLGTTIDKISEVLLSLPSVPNFLKNPAAEFLSLITEDEVSKLKRPGTNVEAAMQFVGQKFEDLIKFIQPQGIHSIPDSAFPDLTLDHDIARLEQALKDLGVSPESATVLATDYPKFAKRYKAINLDKSTKDKNFLKQPLRILYRDGELPPQVVFSMMLGALNWVNQHPTSTPFRSNYQQEEFLYGGKQKLDDNEKAELAKLGYGYQTAAKDIGSNIVSILKLAPKKLKIDDEEIDTSLYFDHLVPALGLIAVETAIGKETDPTALMHLEHHTWNFDDAHNPNRVFNNYVLDENEKAVKSQPYKHLKVRKATDKAGKEIPYKFSKEKVQALKEVSDSLQIEHKSHLPLQEPAKVDDSIQNSFGGIPGKVKEVLKTIQNTVWTKAGTLDVLAKLSEHTEQIEKLIGIQAISDTDHSVIKESREASNRLKRTELAEILDAYNDASNPLEKFYFKYRLQNQHRILMEGNINPQQSKIARYLFRPFNPTTYEGSDINYFKVAVAANMGFKVDKNKPEAAIAAFNEMVANESVLDAVMALSRINEPGQAKVLADRLSDIQSTFGGNMSILNAITGLNQYMSVSPDKRFKSGRRIEVHDKFESDIVFEIDGIANGFAMNILQFPNFIDSDGKDHLEEYLKQTGTSIGAPTKTSKYDPTKNDVYQTLAAFVKKFATRVKAIQYWYTKNKNDPKAPKFKASLYDQREKFLNRQLFTDFVDGSLRDLVKYPFMINMYGGGIESISEGVAKQIVDVIYEELNTLYKQYASIETQNPALTKKIKAHFRADKIIPYIKAINSFQGLPFEMDNTAFANIITSDTNDFQTTLLSKTNLIKNIGQHLQPRFHHGLNEMLGGTKDGRNAVIAAGEVLHAVFLQHFNKAKAEKLKGTNRTNLTKREIIDLTKEQLLWVLPQYKGPLSELSENDESFVDLTKLTTDNNKSSEEIVEVNFRRDNKDRVTESVPRQTVFDSPGVSALIRLIINLDSSILTLTLGQHPNVLPLHDAMMGSPLDLVPAGKDYNTNYLAINRNNSILDTIYKQVQKVLTETQKLDKENNTNLYDQISPWLLKNAKRNENRLDYKKEGLDEIVTDIEKALSGVKDDRRKLQRKISKAGGIESEQMYMGKYTADKTKPEPSLVSQLLEEIQLTIEDKIGVQEDTRTETEIAIDKLIDNTFRSINDLPRANPEPVEIGDITENNVNTFFNKLNEFSANYYTSVADQAEHTAVLKNVLSKLAKGLNATNEIHLTLEEIDGITQGQYVPEREKMRVSLSRKPPAERNGQSPQEVYVHEMLHAMISVALDNAPLLARRVERLFQQVKRDLGPNGYHVFLYDIQGKPSQGEIDTAKKQYNYVFNNPDPDHEQNRLHEFLAYAVTNKALVKYLSNTNIKRPVRDKTLLGRLMSIVDQIVEQFRNLIHKGKQKTAYHEMLAVTEHLVAIQSKHESKYRQMERKLYTKLDEADQKIRNFGNDTGRRLFKRGENKNLFHKLTNSAIGAARLTLSPNSVTHKASQQIYERLNKTFRSLAKEVGGGTLTPELIELLLHSKVNVSKARQEAERFTVEWFNGIWKSVDPSKDGEMSVATREALTKIMFQTDLSSLFDIGFKHNKIANLIGNYAAIQVEKNNIEKQLKLNHNHNALVYARELGRYLVTGKTSLRNVKMNSYALAQDHLPNISAERIALLDAYATLTSLEHLENQQEVLVAGLIKNEFAKDSKENGIINLLDSHYEFKDRSLEHLFQGNPIQTVKGYIVDRMDNLTTLQTGTVADGVELRKEGFKESYDLSAIPDINQAHTKLYIARTLPPVPDASGAMSITNQRNMGTTLSEMLAKDPKYQDAEGNPKLRQIKIKVKNFIRQETSRAQTVKEDSALKLRAVTDDSNKIVDYRIIMDHASKKDLLNPEMEIQNVFAHMNSTYVDRKHTIINDKEIIDALVTEQEDLYKNHPDEFIDFLDPESEYSERYRKLPRDVRMYIDKFAINGTFMVREEIIDKVFGFRVHDLRQLKIFKNSPRARKYAGLAHYFIRQVVGYGKDRIVIAMPVVVLGNIFSNIAQLSMRKIPIAYTFSKLVEGYHEFHRYKQDHDELTKLQNKIRIRESKKLPANPADIQRVKQLTISMKNNRIHAMSLAGLNSLIVEDVNEASTDGFIKRMQKSIKSSKHGKYLDRVPTKVSDLAGLLFMSKSSAPYQLSRHVVQLTDFLARYVMIEHAMEVKGQDFNTAMHEALDAFVLFDETLTPAMEALDAIGATVFLSYFLRNQRSSRQVVQASPVGVGISAVTQYATGLPTMGNLNSSFVVGDIEPNFMWLDESFDEATTVTGVDRLITAYNDFFN